MKVNPYLSKEAYEFYDTFFRLLGQRVTTPDPTADEELGLFIFEHRSVFIDMMLNVPGTVGAYKQKAEMLDKYLPGWMGK